MLIQTKNSGFTHPHGSQITAPQDYLQRRELLRQWARGVAGVALGQVAARQAWAASGASAPTALKALRGEPSQVAGAASMERVTDEKDASTYNNYYEFGTDKSEPAQLAHTLETTPWAIEVSGLVKKPATYHLEDFMRWSPMEERIYRLRCVEGWSMVIPWVGYSLREFLKKVEPQPSARFVQFITLADRARMPGLSSSVLAWPYAEGLRLDEAMHPLTLLSFGMYGHVLPNQNGAPVRLVVPWKYGFKSAKSLVKIRLTEHMPATAWNQAAPSEYGFYSNVNPDVAHPRWSQATERRIGQSEGLFAKRRKTEMFNGYSAQVAALYAGMDLRKNF